VSSLVVLVLLIGVGAYAGVRVWTGSGTTQPESAMPAGVTAFARIDVNPGLGQKLNVDGLVKKFPTGGKSASRRSSLPGAPTLNTRSGCSPSWITRRR